MADRNPDGTFVAGCNAPARAGRVPRYRVLQDRSLHFLNEEGIDFLFDVIRGNVDQATTADRIAAAKLLIVYSVPKPAQELDVRVNSTKLTFEDRDAILRRLAQVGGHVEPVDAECSEERPALGAPSSDEDEDEEDA